jgi:subtilisin-like proprotein convertase family protein
VESYSFNGLNLLVPDGNPAGLANVQTISSGIALISEISISLQLSGTYNGDLYAYLSHGASGFAVLLNRTGRTGSAAFGYNDDGFNVTFSDTAPAGDIHVYQDSTTLGVGIPLTGIWQPDGRNIDPDSVTNLSPRSALLSSFNASDANGDWTLFVADMSTGDAHTLQSWGMTITGIPEPSQLLLGGTTLLLFCLRRRKLEPSN